MIKCGWILVIVLIISRLFLYYFIYEEGFYNIGFDIRSRRLR